MQTEEKLFRSYISSRNKQNWRKSQSISNWIILYFKACDVLKENESINSELLAISPYIRTE
jgi:hypothetical protein